MAPLPRLQHLPRRTASGVALSALHGELVRRATTLADQVETDAAVLGSIIASGILAPDKLQFALDPGVIAAALEVPVAALSDRLFRFSCPFALGRRGVETRIIAGDRIPAPDAVLQRTLAEAHSWARALRAGTSLTDIAWKTGRSEPYIRTRIPLAFLTPKLQAAILERRHPVQLSVVQLLRDDIPMGWNEHGSSR